jgi:hypothetical protein
MNAEQQTSKFSPQLDFMIKNYICSRLNSSEEKISVLDIECLSTLFTNSAKNVETILFANTVLLGLHPHSVLLLSESGSFLKITIFVFSLKEVNADYFVDQDVH